MNLIAFLLERDPASHELLMTLGDQYYSAPTTSKVQKETPFNAFAYEVSSEISDEEVEDYAAQRFARERPQYQSWSWD